MEFTIQEIVQKSKDFNVTGYPNDLSVSSRFRLDATNIKLPDRKLDESDLHFLNMFYQEPFEGNSDNPVPVEIKYYTNEEKDKETN